MLIYHDRKLDKGRYAVGYIAYRVGFNGDRVRQFTVVEEHTNALDAARRACEMNIEATRKQTAPYDSITRFRATRGFYGENE